MKVKELIEKLEQFDENCLIELYNLNYTDSRFDLNFEIRGLYFEESSNAVVVEIKNKGE